MFFYCLTINFETVITMIKSVQHGNISWAPATYTALCQRFGDIICITDMIKELKMYWEKCGHNYSWSKPVTVVELQHQKILYSLAGVT